MKTQVLRYESGCWFERPVGERSCDGAARHPGRLALRAARAPPALKAVLPGEQIKQLCRTRQWFNTMAPGSSLIWEQVKGG